MVCRPGVPAGWAARRGAPGSARAPAANKKADITGKKYGLIWRQTVIFWRELTQTRVL